jgi:hypothetical protein
LLPPCCGADGAEVLELEDVPLEPVEPEPAEDTTAPAATCARDGAALVAETAVAASSGSANRM